MVVFGGVCIDYVFGLMWLWVIFDGVCLFDGVYLCYLMQDLLWLVVLELWCNCCIVIGEDFGIVLFGLCDKFVDEGLFGMCIFWFECEYMCDDFFFKVLCIWALVLVVMMSMYDLFMFVGWWIGNDLCW